MLYRFYSIDSKSDIDCFKEEIMFLKKNNYMLIQCQGAGFALLISVLNQFSRQRNVCGHFYGSSCMIEPSIIWYCCLIFHSGETNFLDIKSFK